MDPLVSSSKTRSRAMGRAEAEGNGGTRESNPNADPGTESL
jgi:hypothetical protein